MKVQYGIMSNKWEIEAPSKLTAYAAIIISLPQAANMIALYSEECREDSWLFSDNIEKRLGEIFGGSIEDFHAYIQSHEEEIKEAFNTITKLV